MLLQLAKIVQTTFESLNYNLSRNNPNGVRYKRHKWLQIPALAISDYCGKVYSYAIGLISLYLTWRQKQLNPFQNLLAIVS